MKEFDKIYLNDLKNIVTDKNINFEILKDKTIFVTGATGIIGSLFVNSILFLNKESDFNCNVVALVRNKEKAQTRFDIYDKNIKLIIGDITTPIKCEYDIDYILHAASETSSLAFVNTPVEAVDSILFGTKNILDLAKNKKIKKLIYLSTMEVYGCPTNDDKITENYSNGLNSQEVRNCYPISKIMCENFCKVYSQEYLVNYDILRLTQTFGPGIQYGDKRVFAEFIRSVIESKDIVLHTKGETKRNYLYTADAIRAIFLTMTSSLNNNVYNVANEETYCTIFEMAKLMTKLNNKIDVKIELAENINNFGYAKTLHMNLDTTKIKELGFKPNVNLEDMFKNTIESMKKNL